MARLTRVYVSPKDHPLRNPAALNCTDATKFTAHPSFAEDDEIAAVKGPLSLALSESDHFFTPEKKTSTEAALAKGKSPYQITIYGGTGHGFGIRGDMSDPKQKFAKEAAFHQASMWFAEYL